MPRLPRKQNEACRAPPRRQPRRRLGIRSAGEVRRLRAFVVIAQQENVMNALTALSERIGFQAVPFFMATERLARESSGQSFCIYIFSVFCDTI